MPAIGFVDRRKRGAVASRVDNDDTIVGYDREYRAGEIRPDAVEVRVEEYGDAIGVSSQRVSAKGGCCKGLHGAVIADELSGAGESLRPDGGYDGDVAVAAVDVCEPKEVGADGLARVGTVAVDNIDANVSLNYALPFKGIEYARLDTRKAAPQPSAEGCGVVGRPWGGLSAELSDSACAHHSAAKIRPGEGCFGC